MVATVVGPDDVQAMRDLSDAPRRRELGVGGILLTGALALPWLTWLPWWGYGTAGEAAREIPLFLFTALALLAVGIWLTQHDAWLGVLVIYVALRAIGYRTALSLATAHWIAIGAVGLVGLAKLSPEWQGALRWGLILSGAFEALYCGWQALGHDPRRSWPS